MPNQTKGNCYLCGAQLGKAAIKNHMLKQHQVKEGGQACYLVKIEGAFDKNYWLYVDIPIDKTLSALDDFLRKIWLECCGHLSAFRGAGDVEIGKSRKISMFSVGDKLIHEYDFGTTTESLITIMGETVRKPQRGIVRLLARNEPPVFTCGVCGNTADRVCCECLYSEENPFYCEECSEQHEHDEMFLPVTNSPRMGECGYEGGLDVYEFDPSTVAK